MVSVIIVNWNGKHHLEECFNSLREQTFKDFEVILVDNGSTDGSVEFVSTNYPEIRSISLDYNSGFCKGNNLGIKQAQGEIIVLLNNDTSVSPEWLKCISQAFSENADAGICASRVVLYDTHTLLDSAGDGYSIAGAGFKRGHLDKTSKYNLPEYVFGACGAGMAFRKSMLDKIGLLDEDFFAIFEDVDISFRAQLAGYKCLYVPGAVIYHKVNSTIGTMSKLHVYNGQRNVEYVYFKNMPGRLIWKTIHLHILYNILGFGYFFIKGRGLTFLKAKLDFIKNIGLILEKRKMVKQISKVPPEYIYGMLERKWLKTRIKGKLD